MITGVFNVTMRMDEILEKGMMIGVGEFTSMKLVMKRH